MKNKQQPTNEPVLRWIESRIKELQANWDLVNNTPEYKDVHLLGITGAKLKGYKEVYDYIKSHPLSSLPDKPVEQEAIAFAVWTAEGLWTTHGGRWWPYRDEDNDISGEELYRIFKRSRLFPADLLPDPNKMFEGSRRLTAFEEEVLDQTLTRTSKTERSHPLPDQSEGGMRWVKTKDRLPAYSPAIIVRFKEGEVREIFYGGASVYWEENIEEWLEQKATKPAAQPVPTEAEVPEEIMAWTVSELNRRDLAGHKRNIAEGMAVAMYHYLAARTNDYKHSYWCLIKEFDKVVRLLQAEQKSIAELQAQLSARENEARHYAELLDKFLVTQTGEELETLISRIPELLDKYSQDSV